MSYYWTQLSHNFPSIYDVNTALKTVNIPNKLDIFGRSLSVCIERVLQHPRTKGMANTRKTALQAYEWKLFTDNDNIQDSLLDTTQRLKKRIENIIGWHNDIGLAGALLIKVENVLNKEFNYNELKLRKIDISDFDKISDTQFKYYDNENDTATIIDYTDDSTDWIYITDGDNEVGGVLRSVLTHIIELTNIVPEWSIVTKRLKGIPIGSTDLTQVAKQASAANLGDEVIQKTLSDLNSLLENLGKENFNSAISTMAGIDVKLATLADTNAAASMQTFKSSLESDVSIAILGQANTTELPANGGSRAALQVLNLIRQDILFTDIINVKKAITKLLEIDNKLNKQDRFIEYYFDFVYDDVVDVLENAQVLQYICSAGIPLELSKQEVYEKIGYAIPESNNPEDIIEISKSPNLPAF